MPDDDNGDDDPTATPTEDVAHLEVQSELRFGDVRVNRRDTLRIPLASTGDINVTSMSLQNGRDEDGPFYIENRQFIMRCSAQTIADGLCAIEITFEPLVEGEFENVVTVFHTGEPSCAEVTLIGVATETVIQAKFLNSFSETYTQLAASSVWSDGTLTYKIRGSHLESGATTTASDLIAGVDAEDYESIEAIEAIDESTIAIVFKPQGGVCGFPPKACALEALSRLNLRGIVWPLLDVILN